MIQSGEVWPLPLALTASLLVTPMIFHVAGPQVSVTCARTVTSTILWFGGQSDLGLTLTVPMTGGVVSTTRTVVEQEAVFVAVSATVTPITFVPKGRSPMKDTFTAAGGLLAGRVLV